MLIFLLESSLTHCVIIFKIIIWCRPDVVFRAGVFDVLS